MLAPNSNPLDRAADLVATYGLAAIVLSLPLEFTAKFMHQQLSRFVIAVVLASFVYLVARRRRPLRLPTFGSVWVLLALGVASIVSWALTRPPGSLNNLLDVALYPFVGLLIVNLVLTEEDHRRAWIAFAVSGVVVAVIGVVLYATGTQIWTPNPAVANRDNITFADPNITARFLTLVACAAVLLYAARKAPSWLLFAAGISCAIVLPMTFSRSGLALFFVMTALAIPFAFDRRRAAAIGAVILVAFAGSTLINPDTRQRATDAATTLTDAVAGRSHTASGPISQGSGITLEDNRVFLIAAGMNMFRDHPLTGVGFSGYQHALLTTYRSYLPAGYTDSLSHTIVVTILAEQGLVGALLLLGFLLLFAREAWAARKRRDDTAVWSTIAAYMVIPIFLYSQVEARFLQEPYLWLSLGMFYGAQLLAQHRVATVPDIESRHAVRTIEVA